MQYHLGFQRLAQVLAGLTFCLSPALLSASELPGYQTPDEFEQAVDSLDEHETVEVSSLGRTAEGRDVHLLTLATGDAAAKPAVLVMGSVDAANLMGSELALRIAQQLAKGHDEGDEAATKLLEAVTLYVIPRPSPDATAHVLDKPVDGTAANTRASDADRDGELDEDPHEDLDGNGVITSLRVADPAGPWMQHPDEPRILVRADPEKNETGQYRLYTEGIDNDGDEQWNEDGAGGVDFNRNFPFEYPYFAGDAGPHQVSEPESRAVADWMFARSNIFLVFSFAPQDNLTKPWQVAGSDNQRIRRQVLKDDEPYYKLLAATYEEQLGTENAPEAADHAGAFAPWAYFHYGRWSIATRGWWIPKVEAASQDDSDDANDDAVRASDDTSGDEEQAHGATTEADSGNEQQGDKKKDSRKRDEINALQWFAEQGTNGFVDWSEIDHPDFPDKKVEVGGFKPLVRHHAPADKLDEIAAGHREFLAAVVALRAKLEFEPPVVESLGAGVFRLKVGVINRGFLPTQSGMGTTTDRLRRLDLEIDLPQGATLLTGHTREDLGVLAGNGDREEHTWLVRFANLDDHVTVKLRAGEPSIGMIEQELVLNESQTPNQETSNDQ